MKILYLAHRIPFPPFKGDKIRSFHEITHLHRSHEIHLLAFCDQAEDVHYAEQLERYCESVTLIPMSSHVQRMKAGLAMLAGRPFSLGYFDSRQMKQAVNRKLSEHKFDAIFVYCSSVAPYVETTDIPKILDFVDSDACKWSQYALRKRAPMKWVYALEAKRLKRYESLMVDVFDCAAFVSSREARHLPERQAMKVFFVQNGVDLEFYKPEKNDCSAHDIVFTGAMNYYPNIDAVKFFATEVFPLVRQEIPDARFLIVGSRPTDEVLQLRKSAGVVVTGTVPDIRPYLTAARVSVAPLRIQQGIQNKILEALAVGLPVVASPSAGADLAHLTRAPLVIAHTPAQYAKMVCSYLHRPRLTDSEIDACRQQLLQHYHWPTNLESFDKVIQALTEKKGMSGKHATRTVTGVVR